MRRFGLKNAAALLVALALLLAGCGQTEVPEADGSLAKVLDARHLVLGLDASFPPMGFTDESGELVGFDIDVAREVCARLGIELVLRPIDWDAKEDELNSGNIDCIWNGMSATPARAESMLLSEPYMRNELILIVSDGSDARVARDLWGGKVGAQAGSSAQEVLEESDLADEVTEVLWGDNLELIDMLKRGELDAVLLDSVVAYYYIAASAERLYVLSDSLSEDELAIGFRKGDLALRDAVQKQLIAMKGDGSLGDISMQWFGTDITIVR